MRKQYFKPWMIAFAVGIVFGYSSATFAAPFTLDNGSLEITIRDDNGAIDAAFFGGSDFFNPGTPVSDWGFQTASNTSTFRLYRTTGSPGQPVTVSSNGSEITVSGNYDDSGANVAFTRQYSLVSGVNVLRIATEVTNNGSNIDLRVFDTFDPDQGFDQGQGHYTFNDRFTLGSASVAQASASQDGSSTGDLGLTSILGTSDPDRVVAAGYPFAITSGTVNQFFDNPHDGDGEFSDYGIHVGTEFSLNAGESDSFEALLSFGNTPAEAQSDFEDASGSPELTTNPVDGGTLDFGNVRVGETKSGTITATNTGDANGLSGSFGSAVGDFGPGSPQAFGPLDQGDNTSRDYTYTPTARGTDSQTFTVTSDANDSSVTLNGNGVGPVFSYEATDTNGSHGPTAPLGDGSNGNGTPVEAGLTLDLGNADWLVGPDTVTASLTLANSTPDGDLDSLTDLTILDFDISGTDADMFSLLKESDGEAFVSTVLGAGEEIDLIVQFEADALLPHGLKEAILTFFTDQGAALRGDGADFRFTLNATQTPEPGSLLVWSLVGVVGLALGWRRRRNVAQAA